MSARVLVDPDQMIAGGQYCGIVLDELASVTPDALRMRGALENAARIFGAAACGPQGQPLAPPASSGIRSGIAELVDSAAWDLALCTSRFKQLSAQFDAVLNVLEKIAPTASLLAAKPLAELGRFIAADWSNCADLSREALEEGLSELAATAKQGAGSASR